MSMCVLQEWVHDLTMMQQSVLISCVRAPDGLPKGHVAKYLWRWYRRCVLFSAFDKRVLTHADEDGGGSFTGPVEDIDGVEHDYLKGVDEVPHHAHLHLMHAAEIIGFKHPNLSVRSWWHEFYCKAVIDMHLHPETVEEMDFRLCDKREQWLKTEQFPA
jgi:hypothetical protein